MRSLRISKSRHQLPERTLRQLRNVYIRSVRNLRRTQLSITFVVPAFNEEARLAYCLASIKGEAPGKPVIVVDNGSTDRTVELAKAMGASVVVETRLGVTRARQAGLLAAETEWVAFIDADNELPEGWMNALLKSIGPEVVAVTGPPVYRELRMLQQLTVSFYYTVGAFFFRFMPMTNGGNTVARRAELLSVGGIPVEIDFYGDDTETAIRLSRVGEMVYNPGMFCWSSARRFNAEGFVVTGTRYALTYFWMWLTGRVLVKTHTNCREV